MDKVYRHGTVNLAATHAVDAVGGLFTKRNPLAYGPCTMALKDSSGIASRYYVQPYLPGTWRIHLEERLNTRAWVYQERRLSPRTIHFAKHQVHCECAEDISSESVPSHVGSEHVENNEKTELRRLEQHARPMQRIRAWNTFWSVVVSEYSGCRLTMQSDILVAVAGLAKHLGRCLGEDCKYLAGLWQINLPYHLMWEAGFVEFAEGISGAVMVVGVRHRQGEHMVLAP